MTKRILLIEDNTSDEKLTLLAFRGCGVPHELLVKRDGVEALAYLCGAEGMERGPSPSLILLDLKLPRVDGFEVLRQLRADAQLRMTPAVVLSASSEREDVERCYALGANAYVRKPLDFVDFKRAVASVSEFWLRWNEQGGSESS